MFTGGSLSQGKELRMTSSQAEGVQGQHVTTPSTTLAVEDWLPKVDG